MLDNVATWKIIDANQITHRHSQQPQPLMVISPLELEACDDEADEREWYE